jgi:hypothetical protein
LLPNPQASSLFFPYSNFALAMGHILLSDRPRPQ